MQEFNLMGKKKQLDFVLFSLTDKDPAASVSLGGKRVQTSNSGGIRGTISRSSGKWYFEFKIIGVETTSGDAISPLVGIGTEQTTLNDIWSNGIEQLTWYSISSSPTGNLLYGAQQPLPTYGAAFTTGANVGIALNMDARQIQFYRNGVGQGIINMDTYTDGIDFYPYVGSPGGVGYSTVDLLTGPNLMYPIPSGFSAW